MANPETSGQNPCKSDHWVTAHCTVENKTGYRLVITAKWLYLLGRPYLQGGCCTAGVLTAGGLTSRGGRLRGLPGRQPPMFAYIVGMDLWGAAVPKIVESHGSFNLLGSELL